MRSPYSDKLLADAIRTVVQHELDSLGIPATPALVTAEQGLAHALARQGFHERGLPGLPGGDPLSLAQTMIRRYKLPQNRGLMGELNILLSERTNDATT